MVNIARIESLRTSKGISKMQLSIQLGYKSYSSYIDKSNGRRKFSLNDIESLSKIFNVSIAELVN